MARIYQTPSLRDHLSPSMEEMEVLALESYAHLPQDFRTLTGEIIIQIAEFPTDEIMDDLSLETPFDLLGLFEGARHRRTMEPRHRRGPQSRHALPPRHPRLLVGERGDPRRHRHPRPDPRNRASFRVER